MLRQRTRSAEHRQEAMIRETVRADAVDPGMATVLGLLAGGPLGERTRSAEHREEAMKRETVRWGAMDGGLVPVSGLRTGGTICREPVGECAHQGAVHGHTVGEIPPGLPAAEIGHEPG